MLLHGLADRIFHDLVNLIAERLQTFSVGAESRTSIPHIIPLVQVLAKKFLDFLLLLFFEFVFELVLLV